MKFSNLVINGNVVACALYQDNYFPLNHSGKTAELGNLIKLGVDLERMGEKAIKTEKPINASSAVHAQLIQNPGKTICLGLNYYDHAKEGGRDKPTYPWFFLRATSSLAAHGQPVLLPAVSHQFDFEAELAVVIGKSGKHISREGALEHVLGYTCFNDVSVRDYQKRTPQWTIGKNFDATGPIGPDLVLSKDLPEGAKNLRISCSINSTKVQDASTTDMIFDVAEAIEILSECMTLEPGDVIAMGTPSGVGAARTPQLWLKDADVVEVEIEKIGRLVNKVTQEVK